MMWSFCRAVARIAPREMILAGIAMAASAAASALAIVSLLPLMRAIGFSSAGDEASRLVGAVTSIVGSTPGLAPALAVFSAAVLLQGLLGRWQARLLLLVSQAVMLDQRRALFERLCRVDWVVYSRFRSADLLDALVRQVDRIGYAARYLLTLGGTAFTTVVYIGLAALISPAITLVIVACGLLLMLALSRVRRRVAGISDEITAASQHVYGVLTESLASMKTIRSYGAEDRHGAELDRAVRGLNDAYLRRTMGESAARLWFEAGAAAVLGLVIFLGASRAAVAPAELVLVILLFVRLAPQLSSLHVSYQGFFVELTAWGDVRRIEAACDAASAPRAERGRAVSFDREIRFDRVSFSYGGEPLLDDITLTIPAGHTVAVVGASGAGKSTLADLVLGLLQPGQGRILMDGAALAEDAMESWRAQVGYVPQDTFLFHDTVRNNLLWAAPAATEADLAAALEAAAADFVVRLPAGLDTIVGDRGVLLSGGERQRLALARAILRRPRLLVLDEATSALDSENEAVIQRAVDGLHGRVAMLVIAHRLSTVRAADVIYVLDQGRIVESGRWDDLMARPGGRFRAFCLAQGLGEEPARLSRAAVS